MIKLLIFSKDRASQLDFLLRSIELYCPNEFDVSVLYKASDSNFELGYTKIYDLYPNIRLYNENLIDKSFRELTIGILGNMNPEWIAISTDDTIIYRPFVIKNEYLQDVDVFSMRYGLNTLVQDPHKNTYQPPLHNYINEGETISWDSSKYNPTDNYGYIFGLDLHAYRAKKFLALISSFDWKNTNQLETGLFHRKGHILPVMRSFKQSVAFNVPVNNMSGATIAGKYYSYSVESLNELFLQGKRISMESLDNVIISGAHQEIEYKFEG